MSMWIDLAKGTYDAGKEFGLWKKLRQKLRRKKRILILGASGVGKTQFVHSLIAPLSARLTPLHRTVAVQHRDVVIDEYPFVLVDTPGQRQDDAKRKVAIQGVIRGGVSGIINITCFGYHEAQESGLAKDAVQVRGPGIAKSDYLESRRHAELELLPEWVPLIDQTMVPWILTLVTKADLWWPDDTGRIKKYYEDREYAETLQHLRAIHSVLPYCSVIEPFYGSKTSARFGDSDRVALRGHFLETLLRLTGVKT